MSDVINNDETRKIIFLFVPAHIESEILKVIASNEYEVYNINENIDPYLPFIKENPNSIIFAYSNNYPKNARWRDHYTMLSTCCSDNGIMISTWYDGENCIKPDPELSNFPLKVDQIDLSDGYSSVLSNILKFLEKINARGRRHFVRLRCEDFSSATFSIKRQTEIFNGRILDISSIGMACVFDKNIDLKINIRLEDMQLRLGGHILSISATIFAKREIDGKTVYIVIFDVNKSAEFQVRICEFIYSSLQKYIRSVKNIKEK